MAIATMAQRKIQQHSVKCRLQQWLEESGENYTSVAEGIGVDVGAIRRLSKNSFDRIDCGTWQAICHYFKKPLGELFYEEGDRHE